MRSFCYEYKHEHYINYYVILNGDGEPTSFNYHWLGKSKGFGPLVLLHSDSSDFPWKSNTAWNHKLKLTLF